MNKPNMKSWEEAVVWLREQADAQDLVKACFFDDPLEEAAQRYAESTEWHAVRELLPAAQGQALDIGAGRGISAYALARDGWSVTALEPDPSAVVGAAAIRQLASLSLLPITVVETWGEELPFAAGQFDLVHCRQVLHHARDLRLLCSQIARVLKPNGFFIATREHVITKAADLPRFLEGHPLHKLYGGEHAYRLQEYRSAIEAAGITLTDVFNPYASDINLFPKTRADLKHQVARALRWPFPTLIPDHGLHWLGALSNSPGRLYTFVGRKALHG